MRYCQSCHNPIRDSHFIVDNRGKEFYTCEDCLSKRCCKCGCTISHPGYKRDFVRSNVDHPVYICFGCLVSDDIAAFKSHGIITPKLVTALQNEDQAHLLGESAERLRRNIANLNRYVTKLEKVWWSVRVQMMKSEWSELKDGDTRMIEIKVNNQAGNVEIAIHDISQNATLILRGSEFTDRLEIISVFGSPRQIQHLIDSTIGLISHHGVFLEMVHDWDR